MSGGVNNVRNKQEQRERDKPLNTVPVLTLQALRFDQVYVASNYLSLIVHIL